MNYTICSGCSTECPDGAFDFKQLTSIHSPLLCRKCLSMSVHLPESKRVEFLNQLVTNVTTKPKRKE